MKSFLSKLTCIFMLLFIAVPSQAYTFTLGKKKKKKATVFTTILKNTKNSLSKLIYKKPKKKSIKVRLENAKKIIAKKLAPLTAKLPKDNRITIGAVSIGLPAVALLVYKLRKPIVTAGKFTCKYTGLSWLASMFGKGTNVIYKVSGLKLAFNKIKKYVKKVEIPKNMRITGKEDLAKLFPKSVEELTLRVKTYTQEAQKAIDTIIAIDEKDRTLENTVLALDRVSSFSNLFIFLDTLKATELIHPNKAVREATQKEIVNIEGFKVEQIKNNKKLCDAIKEYEKNCDKKSLDKETRYFLEEVIKEYDKAGFHLPEEKQQKVKELQKRIGQLNVTFNSNISNDNRTIKVKEENLKGLTKEFIGSLKRDKDGNCILNVNRPTYFAVIANL